MEAIERCMFFTVETDCRGGIKIVRQIQFLAPKLIRVKVIHKHLFIRVHRDYYEAIFANSLNTALNLIIKYFSSFYRLVLSPQTIHQFLLLYLA